MARNKTRLKGDTEPTVISGVYRKMEEADRCVAHSRDSSTIYYVGIDSPNWYCGRKAALVCAKYSSDRNEPERSRDGATGYCSDRLSVN